ncbi:class IV adenylate cyclase [Micromonospora zamorensis]|uniref:class IV adenylate cyclase n=1 Tax=Micromonospora zamorensis TaxID=709883 RepID=UPI0033F49FE4
MEVESKVLLSSDEVDAIVLRLAALGLHLGQQETQRDVYYKERGFRENVQGPGSYLVRLRYKESGTILNMKRLTESDGTWEENETRVDDGQIVEEIVRAIGAEKAVTVTKVRRQCLRDDLEIIIDEVEGMGIFLELAIETVDEPEKARDRINLFLAELEIDPSRIELRGYPTILLEQQGVRFSVK